MVGMTGPWGWLRWQCERAGGSNGGGGGGCRERIGERELRIQKKASEEGVAVEVLIDEQASEAEHGNASVEDLGQGGEGAR